MFDSRESAKIKPVREIKLFTPSLIVKKQLTLAKFRYYWTLTVHFMVVKVLKHKYKYLISKSKGQVLLCFQMYEGYVHVDIYLSFYYIFRLPPARPHR